MKFSLKNTLLAFFIVIPSSFLSFFYVTYNKSVSFPENSFIDVSPGETLSSVIIKLKSRYDFEKSFEVKFVMKALSIEDNITIGRHDLSKITKVKNLVKNLTSPTIQASITLLEGWSLNDIVKYLSNHKDLKMFNKENFKKRCYDVSFINKELGEKIGYNNIVSLEGFLFPETYSVDSYLDEEELLKIFINQYIKETKYIRRKIEDINKTMIIASIIEAETDNVREMDTISSIYNNRIKKGIPFQADPTVLYYMTESDLKKFKESRPGTSEFGKVWKKYKKMDNPYNTYKYMIPPGPINSPGIEAINAAVNPAKTNYLFMVMNSKLGRHLFSDNEKQHLKNIRRN